MTQNGHALKQAGESRLDKFRRVSKQKLEVALQRLDMFEPLSNDYNYEYGEDQVDYIFEKLEAKLEELRRRFEEGLARQENRKLRQRGKVERTSKRPRPGGIVIP